MGIGISGAALLGAAMPGISEAVGNELQGQADQKQANAALPGTQSMIANDPQMQGFQDPTHPAWGILNNLTAGAGQGALPIATPGVAQPQSGGGQPMQGLQNGGVVRANYGRKTIAPSFERGPALPVGPNNTIVGPTSPPMQGMAGYEKGGVVGDTAMGQGITPASTEGQMLMFDAGGVVPQGFQEQPGLSPVPMNGGAAAFVQGLGAGQNLGNNLYQAVASATANRDRGNETAHVLAADADANPNGASPSADPSMLDRAKNAVEGFFQHIHNGTLDDNHKPNGAQAVPAPDASASPAGGPPSGSPIPSNGAPNPAAASGAVPPPTGGAAPAGAAAPSPIPTPAAGATPGGQPSGGPPQPGQPGPQSQPPLNPQQQALAANPALQNVVKQVATNPEVLSGTPDKTPAQSGKPAHSLTPEYWTKLNELKMKAVRSAAMAGEDPAKVYESMTAVQDAHFQGQVLKQAATASRAFDNGDMDAVTQALHNINYYLPNGQNIDVRKATQADVKTDPTLAVGDLVHSNPYKGMYGHENDPSLIKVDQNYLQSLGVGALDPAKMHAAQQSTYSAQQEAQSNHMKAQGEFMTGQGRQLTGAASYGKMNLAQQSQDVDRRLKIAAGNKDQAEANWYNTRQPSGSNTGQPKITMASLRSLQNDAANYTDHIVQGQPTTAPVLVKDPDSNQMVPNLSPGAGKSLPDQSRIPAWATNGLDKNNKPVPLTAEQQENVKVLGGQINSANAGLPGMNTPKAVELAARITHYQSHPTTHTDPATGKPAKDFVYDNQSGTAHVWVGNAYENVYLKPNVADESGAGGGPEAPPPGGNSAPHNGGGENEGPDAFQ